jgi:hypothetical protein
MRRSAKLFLPIAALVLVAVALAAYLKFANTKPGYWEDEVRALELAAQQVPPPNNAVLFIGSSSIRLWSTLAEDMAPIPVIKHGFGGSKLPDLVFNAKRLVNPWHPAAVVVFAGANDLLATPPAEPAALLASYQLFVSKVRGALRDVPVYYIAITPAPNRMQLWPRIQATNQLIQAYTETDEQLYFIDTGPALMNGSGVPDAKYYLDDNMHFNAQGYGVWRELIRDQLLQDFPAYQPAS